MKLGLRLQIVILLGGLLLLSFVPLFYSVATYTEVTLSRVRHEHARMLGRAIAGHVAEARAGRKRAELQSLVRAEVDSEGVAAIGVYNLDGSPELRAGAPELVDQLAARIDVRREALLEIDTEHGAAVAVVVPDPLGAVATVIRADKESDRSTPLVRLVALYTGMFGLGTLVLAYFALTRLIVRPLDALSRAADRVAGGARRLETPSSTTAELELLGASLRTMTEKLLNEEQALRRKIDEVERATQHLKEAQDRLVRSERLASVGRLAAGLAHEVGNPIAAVIGLQDLLIAGGLEASEQQDFLQRMRKETDRINRIIRDLLDFARPAGASADAIDAPGDVARAVHDTTMLLSPQRAFKSMELELTLAQDLPRVPLANERLVQVLLNLLLNAADACNHEGLVELTVALKDSHVEIRVQDSGPGVAEAVQETLFEPFVTTKEVGHGTGLGLAVCKGLVEAAGGSLSLEQTPGAGACFVVELPTLTPEPDDEPS